MNEDQDGGMITFMCPQRPGSHRNVDRRSEARHWARHGCGYGCIGEQIAVGGPPQDRLLKAAAILFEIAAHGDLQHHSDASQPVDAAPGELAVAMRLVADDHEGHRWDDRGELLIDDLLAEVRAMHI